MKVLGASATTRRSTRRAFASAVHPLFDGLAECEPRGRADGAGQDEHGVWACGQTWGGPSQALDARPQQKAGPPPS